MATTVLRNGNDRLRPFTREISAGAVLYQLKPLHSSGAGQFVGIMLIHQVLKAWPNARNISTQHLAILLHDVATCVERDCQTHATVSSFQRNMSMFMSPRPWRARSGFHAHALAQGCCSRVHIFPRFASATCNYFEF